MSEEVKDISSSGLKIVVIGDGLSGKTCLCEVFSKGRFPKEYQPTTYETHRKEMQIGDQKVTLNVEDTAGQEAFDQLRKLIYPGTKCFVLCFDVNAVPSFKNLETVWLPELRMITGGCPPVVLCGTKADLRQGSECDQVSLKSIQKFARKHREVVKYMEVSAMTRPSDPAKVFECAAEAVLFGVDEIKRNQDIEDIYDDPKGCFSGLFKK